MTPALLAGSKGLRVPAFIGSVIAGFKGSGFSHRQQPLRFGIFKFQTLTRVKFQDFMSGNKN